MKYIYLIISFVTFTLFGYSQTAYTMGEATQTNPDGSMVHEGEHVILEGIVHGIDLFTDDKVNFYLLDQSGGIVFFSFENIDYTVTEGDELRVEGVLETYNCLAEITSGPNVELTVEVLSQGNDTFEPIVLEGPMDGGSEGRVLKIKNVTLADPSEWAESGSFNCRFTDGQTEWLVRINSSTNISGSPAPEGAVDIVGLGGQYSFTDCSQGYQLVPMRLNDITPYDPTGVVTIEGSDLTAKIYPNPSTDGFTIDTESIVQQVSIYTLEGKRVWQGVDPSFASEKLNPGMYLVKVQTNVGLATLKLMVQ